MIKGISFDFGEKTLVIPPISLGALEQLQEQLTEFNGNALDKKQLSTVIEAAHAALRRNYPELTREEVGELIDLANFMEVFDCVMDVSGMKRKAIELPETAGTSIGTS